MVDTVLAAAVAVAIRLDLAMAAEALAALVDLR